MMYSNKFTAAIVVAGKILREQKDTVRVPFGSEYSVRIKNLNTVRAVVNVYIDGENAVPGGLVLGAGEQIDLERTIKNNNLTEGNKLKFVQRTDAIEEHRGIGLEDGLIRVEFKFEKVYQRQDGFMPFWNQPLGDKYTYGSGVTQCINQISEFKGVVDKYSVSNGVTGGTTSYGAVNQMNVNGVLRGIDYSQGEATKAAASAMVDKQVSLMNISTTSAVHDGLPIMDCNDAGITVPGSHSSQKFTTTGWFNTEAESYSLVFRLVGKTKDNEPVQEAITVKHKPRCVTCNKLNKAHANFCVQCGTALEIFA